MIARTVAVKKARLDFPIAMHHLEFAMATFQSASVLLVHMGNLANSRSVIVTALDMVAVIAQAVCAHARIHGVVVSVPMTNGMYTQLIKFIQLTRMTMPLLI